MDLVKNLCEQAGFWAQKQTVRKVLTDAATEIERLQSANDGQKEAIVNQMKTIQSLQAEIERLQKLSDALTATEDGEPIYPGRVLYYLDSDVIGSYVAGGGGIEPGLFSTRKAAKAAREK